MATKTIKDSIIESVSTFAPKIKFTSTRATKGSNEGVLVFFDNYPDEDVIDAIKTDLEVQLASFKITKFGSEGKNTFDIFVQSSGEDDGYLTVYYNCFSHKYA